jgi:hypothetical protein
MGKLAVSVQMVDMENDVALHFRIGSQGWRSAEAFQEIVFVLERLGAYLSNERGNLGTYLNKIKEEAARSPMADEVPRELPDFHQQFDVKYDIVREARNTALHEGALARHLTSNAVELACWRGDYGDVIRSAIFSSGILSVPSCGSLSFIGKRCCRSFAYLPVLFRAATQVATDFRFPGGQCLRKVESYEARSTKTSGCRKSRTNQVSSANAITGQVETICR